MNIRTNFTGLACVLIASTVSAASYYDGSTALLCTAQRFHQCDAEDGCVKVKPQEIGFSRNQWIIDFKNKTVKPSDPSIDRQVKIAAVQYIKSTLYAQAIEQESDGNPNGVAWSFSVSDPDGAMTLAIATKDAAFIADGVCVPTK